MRWNYKKASVKQLGKKIVSIYLYSKLSINSLYSYMRSFKREKKKRLALLQRKTGVNTLVYDIKVMLNPYYHKAINI